jgi:hypothetical protein
MMGLFNVLLRMVLVLATASSSAEQRLGKRRPHMSGESNTVFHMLQFRIWPPLIYIYHNYIYTWVNRPPLDDV